MFASAGDMPKLPGPTFLTYHRRSNTLYYKSLDMLPKLMDLIATEKNHPQLENSEHILDLMKQSEHGDITYQSELRR